MTQCRPDEILISLPFQKLQIKWSQEKPGVINGVVQRKVIHFSWLCHDGIKDGVPEGRIIDHSVILTVVSNWALIALWMSSSDARISRVAESLHFDKTMRSTPGLPVIISLTFGIFSCSWRNDDYISHMLISPDRDLPGQAKTGPTGRTGLILACPVLYWTGSALIISPGQLYSNAVPPTISQFVWIELFEIWLVDQSCLERVSNLPWYLKIRHIVDFCCARRQSCSSLF